MAGVPVDDLVQFLAEELAKETDYYGLVIDAPLGAEKFWLAGPKTPDNREGLVHAEVLSGALHRVSQAWEYTSKDHLVDDRTEHSAVKTAAILAKERAGSSLVLWAPREDPVWVVELEQAGRRYSGLTLREALGKASVYLLGTKKVRK